MSIAQRRAEAVLTDGRIELAMPYRLKEVVKSLPGARWDPRRRLWHVPATPAAARAAVEILTPHGVEIDHKVLALAEQADAGAAIRNAEPGDLEPIPATRTRPWHHQVIGYHLIVNQPATLLAWEMGVGKSKAVVDAACNLDGCRRVLIVCPKSVVAVWPAEFDKHAGGPVRVLALSDGSVARRTSRARQAVELAEARAERVVVVVNYEAAWQGAFGEWALTVDWDMVVADEVHRIKSPSGRASRFMEKVGRRAGRRVGLSGTPMPHSPLDAYAQFRFLDPGIFGTSFVRFRARYAVMGGYGGHQVLGFQHRDELNEKFYQIAHRVRKADVLDLPAVLHEQRQVALGARARRLYHELEAEFIAEVGSGVVTAANALARLLRLQQVTSGFAVTVDGETVGVDDAKAEALAEVLEDVGSGEAVVVFCRFRRDLDAVRGVAERAERRCFELSGRVNELAEWQGATGGEVLAVQIQAGGVGVDLTRSALCVYYSLGFSLGDYEQSQARLHRPGQTRPVTYLHLIAGSTVDEKVYAALSRRADVIESILANAKEQPNEQ